MKIAVDRRRLDVHAGARLGPLARARPDRRRELVLHDIDAERREVVGGARRADARRGRASTGRSSSRATSTARSTAPTSCSSRSASAARRRGSPTRRCRSRAAASARRRPAPAASRRRCARCRSCSSIAERVRERAADGAWIVDFTNPVGIVTRALLDAGPPRRRALQRRDRLPADVRAPARRRAGARRRRPGRAQPPDLGARASGSTARTCCPSCSPSTATSSRPSVGLPRAAARRARRRPVATTCTTSTRTTRCSPSSSTACRAPPTVAEIERELLELYRDPTLTRSRRCSSSAAARSTARRRSGSSRSLATGDDAVHVVDVRNGDTLAGLARRRRRRGAGARRAATGPSPLPQPPLAPELLGLDAARRRLRAARRARPP